MHEQIAMDYCRKAHCLLPCGKLDGLCTQECYAHEPLPFQWPSRMSGQQVLTLVQTYVSRSRWWHGTASRSFAPPQFPSSIGTPWRSAWCGDPGQPLSPIRLVWSLPDKRLWNAKMKLIVRSSFQMHSIPVPPSYGHQLFPYKALYKVLMNINESGCWPHGWPRPWWWSVYPCDTPTLHNCSDWSNQVWRTSALTKTVMQEQWQEHLLWFLQNNGLYTR